MFNSHCYHVGKVAVQNVMLKYGGDTTVEAVEKAERCSHCRDKISFFIQIIYVVKGELSMHSLHIPKDNKDF